MLQSACCVLRVAETKSVGSSSRISTSTNAPTDRRSHRPPAASAGRPVPPRWCTTAPALSPPRCIGRCRAFVGFSAKPSSAGGPPPPWSRGPQPVAPSVRMHLRIHSPRLQPERCKLTYIEPEALARLLAAKRIRTVVGMDGPAVYAEVRAPALRGRFAPARSFPAACPRGPRASRDRCARPAVFRLFSCCRRHQRSRRGARTLHTPERAGAQIVREHARARARSSDGHCMPRHCMPRRVQGVSRTLKRRMMHCMHRCRRDRCSNCSLRRRISARAR